MNKAWIFFIYGVMFIFKVKVIAGSSQDKIVGWINDEVLKVKVSSPPEKGEANKRMIQLFSKAFAIPSYNITIIRGKTSTQKMLQINLEEEKVKSLLQRITEINLNEV